MSEKRCATCRFFGSPAPLSWTIWDENPQNAHFDENYQDGESEHRLCARVQHGNGGSGREQKALATDLAVVTDGSGYAARLRVLPTFGCVLHEEATPKRST